MIIKKKFAGRQIKKVIFLLLFFCFLITPLIIIIPVENNKSVAVKVATVGAATFDAIKNDLTNAAEKVGIKEQGINQETNLKTTIGKAVKVVLLFLGIIAIIMIIIGGLMWMTAGGNEERAKKARGILINAIIGLLIVLLAYVITYWIVDTLGKEVLNV
ncbi:hypothetical protein HY750_00290 [Candidatus Kuenenbacteria bacterium]|nr:hypothetical protein [Candidatus Kuenenbacteria bacterium]